jgi:membrane-bound serine protease (ClpP class)
MVTIGHSIHYVQAPDGSRKFVDQPEYDKLIAAGYKPVAGVPDPISGDKELLTIHTQTAQKIGLCKTVADTPDDLAKAMNLQIIDTFEQGSGDKIVELLNSTACRAILIGLFFLCVKIAFSAPGHGAAEAGVIVTLGLLVGMPMLTGYGQWWEILAIFAGLALVAFEIFVFPGHMISGLVGGLLVVGGLVMTFVPKEPHGIPGFMPSLPGTYTAIERGLIAVLSGMICSILLWLWLQKYLPKLPYFRRLVLTTTSGGNGTAGVAVQQGAWPKTGDVGKATTDLRPGGKAAFFDEALGDSRITQVVSESGFVSAESAVVVREVAGNRVVVRTVV